MLLYYFVIYGELKSTIILIVTYLLKGYCHVFIEGRLIFTAFFANGRSEHETLLGEDAAVAV